jgi:flagellar motor switch protein FliN
MSEPRGASEPREATVFGASERHALDDPEGRPDGRDGRESEDARGDARSDARSDGRTDRDSRELRGVHERKPVDTGAMESLLHDVPLEVSVELGRVRLSLGELASRLAPGSVIALDKSAGALLDVRVQSRLIARAEAVAIGERCGIRILELVGGNDS